MVYDKVTLFEQFVGLTDFIWYFFESNPYISLTASAASIVINWGIFRHHFEEIKSHQYFMDNIEVVGRFCGNSYDMWKTICMSIIPLGFVVIVFTVVTKARTKPFMATFGTRGASRFKMVLIKRAMRERENKQ